MTDYIWIYSPNNDKENALKIARTLVEEKLIACANLIDSATSIYEWKGEVCEDKEYLLIMKTHKSKFEEVKQWVTDLHVYEVPAIIAIPIYGMNDSYSDFLASNVL